MIIDSKITPPNLPLVRGETKTAPLLGKEVGGGAVQEQFVRGLIETVDSVIS